jgi:hypothetical protein
VSTAVIKPDYQNGNGNGRAPWYVQAVATLGLATVLALGFFAWVTQSVDRKLDAMASLPGMVTAHIDSSGRVNAEILFYLRSMCINSAKNEVERGRCVPPP